MEKFFLNQAALLKNSIEKGFKKRAKELLPLLIAVCENCNAIPLLRRGDFLNEAVVLMRVLIERTITYCYLVVGDDEALAEYKRLQIPSEGVSGLERVKDFDDPQVIIEAAREYHPESASLGSSRTLREKIEVIKERTELPTDLFLIAVATVYPNALSAIDGSLYGCLFHLGILSSPKPIENGKEFRKRFRDQFSELYFLGGLMISSLVQLLGETEDIGSILKESKKDADLARQLMKRSTSKSSNWEPDPEELWDSAQEMEYAAAVKLSKELEAFEKPFRQCYACGVEAPTLPSSRSGQIDISIAALFLKRSLNDFRTIWLLTRMGYTSQAAAVAASLFEHALTVNYLAGSPERTRELLENSTGDVPWSVLELSKGWAKNQRDQAVDRGKALDEAEYRKSYGELYSGYKFLCKIKHPTMRSTFHDSQSTKFDDSGYVLMAAPDLTEEDTPLKALVLTQSVSRCLSAIDSFVSAAECDHSTSAYKRFKKRMKEIREDLERAFEIFFTRPLPFDISDEAAKWFRR
jgi:hypothetical protein